MRERLIELIKESFDKPKYEFYTGGRNCAKGYVSAQTIADYLLDNGVIVLPDDRFYKLRGLILDVNTAEIGNQIADDNLGSWTCSWRESAEKLIRDLYTHDREKTVSELAELKGE